MKHCCILCLSVSQQPHHDYVAYVLSYVLYYRDVDDVLIDAPPEITREMMASLNISMVVKVYIYVYVCMYVHRAHLSCFCCWRSSLHTGI